MDLKFDMVKNIHWKFHYNTFAQLTDTHMYTPSHTVQSQIYTSHRHSTDTVHAQ